MIDRVAAGATSLVVALTLVMATAAASWAGAGPLETLPTSASGAERPVGSDAGGAAANFRAEVPSAESRYLADWIAATQDHQYRQFVIVDKKMARLYVFDAQARLQGATAVLLGTARGDDSAAGIGGRELALIRPEERTTPAGRFQAERGRNLRGEDIVWIDYDNAVSMHRVRTANRKEKRLERLATPRIDDNRISYGCINVPADFYNVHIRPMFLERRAMVYVLPEVKSLGQVFNLETPEDGIPSRRKR